MRDLDFLGVETSETDHLEFDYLTAFDELRESIVGFDYGALFKVAGGLIQGGVNMAEQQKAEKESATDQESKLAAAIQADLNATNLAAKADVSGQLKQKSAAADLAAAQKAVAVQNIAGAGMSPESTQKRIDAGQKMFELAQKNAKEKPKDGYRAAVLKAWTATMAKLRNPSGVSEREKNQGNEEPFLTRRVLGPIPGYGVVVGSVGLLGIVGYVIKRIISK